jgi:hypothetical protein
MSRQKRRRKQQPNTAAVLRRAVIKDPTITLKRLRKELRHAGCTVVADSVLTAIRYNTLITLQDFAFVLLEQVARAKGRP